MFYDENVFMDATDLYKNVHFQQEWLINYSYNIFSMKLLFDVRLMIEKQDIFGLFYKSLSCDSQIKLHQLIRTIERGTNIENTSCYVVCINRQ